MRKTHTSHSRIPKYRRQKRENCADQAFVELNRTRHYLGKFDSPESKQAYERLISEWLAGGRTLPIPKDELLISELVIRFFSFAEGYYRGPNGKPTSEIEQIKLALRSLRKLYGETEVRSFGPRSLKAVRQKLIDQGGSRMYINRHINRVKLMFRWGVEEELVEPSIYHGLKAVTGLKLGRSEAPEGRGVKPVPDSFVDAIEPFVSKQVWTMVQMQRLTAARAGELVIMRPIDIDMTGRIWLYKPEAHKTAYRGHARIIYIGPRAQTLLKPFLHNRPTHSFIFSPKEAESQRHTEIHAQRKTPLSCGNRPGTNRKSNRMREPGERYSTGAYRRAIARGCEKAFPPPDEIKKKSDVVKRRESLKQWHREHNWHPHQLRHNAATFLRKEFGLEAAQLILGHRKADITQLYTELNHTKALDVAAQVG